VLGGAGGGVLTAGTTGRGGAAGGVTNRGGATLAGGAAAEAGGFATGAAGAAGFAGGTTCRAGGVGCAAVCCLPIIAFSTSPGLEMCDKSIFVFMPSGSVRVRADALAEPWPSELPLKWARTFSAS
jgi:hypothetical protein